MPVRNVLFILCVAACGATPSAEDRASAYMTKTARDPSCFAYMRESSNAAGTVVAVRERHDGACGGDPGVEPVIARLRVAPTGALERFDTATDSWQPVAS